MIKGHTDIDIWNTGFFINADYFSDDFIIYNNTGKDLTRKTCLLYTSPSPRD